MTFSSQKKKKKINKLKKKYKTLVYFPSVLLSTSIGKGGGNLFVNFLSVYPLLNPKALLH